MCLNVCKKVNNETDITCYKYVKIKPNIDGQFTIVSPFYEDFTWVIGCCVYSEPDNKVDESIIGRGFFHTFKSYYTAVREARCSCIHGGIMAVVECIIPKGTTVYSGLVNGSVVKGYASTCLMANRIVYLDKPEYNRKWYKGLSAKIEEYKNYRKQMKVFNKIKEHFNLNKINCRFNPEDNMIK